MKSNILLLLLNLMLSVLVFGQKPNKELKEIAKLDYGNGWIELKEELNIDASTIFKNHKNVFNLGVHDEMEIKKREKDNIDITHYRFQQTYKSIIVEGAEYIVHEKNTKAIKANGKIVDGLNLNVNPIISQKEAFDKAIVALPSTKYMWEDKNEEDLLKEIKKDKNATYYPKIEIVITPNSDGDVIFIAENFCLAYKIDIYTKEPYDGYSVYIDAKTGAIVKKIPLIMNCVNGSACTLYNSTSGIQQTIKTDFVSGSGYRLFDDCRGNGVHTENSSLSDIYDADNTWTTDCHYPQTHWGGEMTYDYFLQKHGRKSFDDNNALMLQVVGGCTDNASWSPGGHYTTFCAGSGNPATNWVNALDIIGHEWTHGVTQFTAALIYSGQSGALNESFSDIFGSMVECYAQYLYDPNNPNSCEDFLIGEDMWTGGALRDMCNPLAKGNPDTYGGTYWSNTGVHNRSGVQNKWFCLITKGGNGTNNSPTPYTYNVVGIGKEKAAAISYRSLTVYLVKSSNYADARQGAIEAARDLFGDCSNEMLQTAEAWNAVGVYKPTVSVDLNVCGDFYKQVPSTSHIFIATNNIYAGNICTPANTTIHSGATVVLKAGNEIILGDGFIAEAGSEFHAYIFDCGSSSYKKDMSDNYSSAASNTSATSQYTKENENENMINKNTSFSIYPNPVTSIIKIVYAIDTSGEVTIELLDIFGRKTKTLLKETYHPAGEFSIIVQGEQLSAGIYFCNFKSSTQNSSQKLIILRQE